MTHIPAPPIHIEFAGISKAYPNGVQALQDIDLTIRQGEIFGIIGRSGAGKSTLLRLFNRLESADSGEMFIHGESTVRYSTRQLRDLRRRVAMIFQHFNLMATKTVAQNIALPLKMAGIPAGERQRRVTEMLELVGLSALRDSYPARLSGGQKQRTGIARALVTQPEILLCDEATSALDPENTLSVLTLLKEINQRLGLTIVLITHEMEVIRTLCDRVSVLEGGRIVEQGEVWRVFGNPQHPVTRAMLGLQHPDRPPAVQQLRAYPGPGHRPAAGPAERAAGRQRAGAGWLGRGQHFDPPSSDSGNHCAIAIEWNYISDPLLRIIGYKS